MQQNYAKTFSSTPTARVYDGEEEVRDDTHSQLNHYFGIECD